MNLPLVILVAIGGFLGGACRHAVTIGLNHWAPNVTYHLDIFLVNVVGCFLLGLFMLPLNVKFQRSHHKAIFSSYGQALICIGFLGSFTTFSDFGMENFQYLKTTPHLFFLNTLLHFIVGIACVFLGVIAKRLIWSIRH